MSYNQHPAKIYLPFVTDKVRPVLHPYKRYRLVLITAQREHDTYAVLFRKSRVRGRACVCATPLSMFLRFWIRIVDGDLRRKGVDQFVLGFMRNDRRIMKRQHPLNSGSLSKSRSNGENVTI